MNPTTDSTLTDPQRIIADLQRANAELHRKLSERTAERDGCAAQRDEALAREAALAEVLQAINTSPAEPSLVFNTILAKAHDLCDASFGSLQLYENEHFRAVATHGMPEDMAALVLHPYRMHDPDTPGGHFLAGGRFYQAAVRRQADRPAPELCRAGGYCDGECSADHRDARSAGAANRYCRGVAGHQFLARRSQAGVRGDAGKGDPAVLRRYGSTLDDRGRARSYRSRAWSSARVHTDRGEFGESDPETEIARLRSRLGDHYSFERARPDGSVIEVRHNPMPDGGF